MATLVSHRTLLTSAAFDPVTSRCNTLRYPFGIQLADTLKTNAKVNIIKNRRQISMALTHLSIFLCVLAFSPKSAQAFSDTLTVPTQWWTNRTSNNGVYEFYQETVRLHDAYSGYIEGTINLPLDGLWNMDWSVHRDGDLNLPNEYVKMWVNGQFVAEVNNIASPANVPIQHTVDARSVSYRFEFSSPQWHHGYHLYVGTGTLSWTSPPPPTLISGFQSEVFATSVPSHGDLVRGIDFGPGGDFGSDLYVVVNNRSDSSSQRILKIGNDGGIATYASGLNGPWGLDFSAGGAFGNYLYYNGEDNPDGLARIDPITQGVEKDLVYINEGTALAVSQDGDFGQFIYAGQAVGGAKNRIFRIDDNFNLQSWFEFDPGNLIIDLAFSEQGTFGSLLYGTLSSDDGSTDVFRIDSNGVLEILAELPDCGQSFLTFSPGGIWGEYIYLSNSTNGEILRLDPDGNINVFATGLTDPAGLRFAPNGSALFVGQSNTPDLVLKITPEPSTLILSVLGGIILWLRRPDYVPATVRGYHR